MLTYVYFVLRLFSSPHFFTFIIFFSSPLLIRLLLKTMLGVFDLSLHIVSSLSRSLPVCPLILRVFVTFLKTWKLDRLIWISSLLRLYVKYLVRLSVMLALVFFLVLVLANLLFRIYSRFLLKICYYYSMLV